MHKKVPPKPLGFMDRKVPKNEKFSHVPGRLDTGLTVNKVKFITAQEFAKRRNEIFYRLSRCQLYQLYSEYEANENENMGDSNEYGGSSSPKIVTYSESAQAINEKPYLILDCREPEDFCECHLLHARSFPFTMMRRDQVHPEFYNFRNKEETLIIIYCDDERMSCDAAKLFVDRGTDNIFLLSGGLNEFAAEYPAFVEGELPQAALPKKLSSSTRRTGLTRIAEDGKSNSNEQSPYQSRASTSNTLNAARLSSLGRGPPLTGGTSGMGGSKVHGLGGSRRGDDRSESGYSMNSNVSVAESIISRSVSRKGKF